MLKWFKFLCGLLLLPLCVSGMRTVAHLVGESAGRDTVWVAVGAGAACWMVLHVMLPKPMLVYVFGHELTHALWAWAFGASVRGMKVSARGGHVLISKTNFLIALAPYFFPLYAMIIVAVYAVGTHIWGWGRGAVWFHLALGAAYAFHLTLTSHILQTRQSDITEHGWFFSGVVIVLGNLVVLIAGLPFLLERPTPGAAWVWWWENTLWLARLADGTRF